VEFDSVTNEFRGAGIGSGLTCATFVVALMRRAGFRLIDVGTWKSDNEDAALKAWAINRLRASLGPDHPHVEAMARQDTLYRVRPGDVAGAGQVASAQWPVSFDIARAGGVGILRALQSISAGSTDNPAATP
jgi:hypothetical protein